MHRVVLVLALGFAGCAAEEPEPRGSYIELIGEPELQPFGRLPEQQPGFRAVDVEPDRLVYTFDPTATGPDGGPPIAAMTVVGGEGAGGYVRRVNEVRDLGGGVYEAITEPGHLGDLYRRLHLIVHYRPRWDAEFRSDAIDVPGDVAGRRAALEGDCGDTAPCDVGGPEVTLSGGVSLHPFIEPSFDAEFELDIDETAPFDCVAGGFGLWGDCPSPLEKALLTVDGSVTAGFELTASGAVSISDSVDLTGSLPGFSLFSGSAPLGIGAITVEAEPVLEGTLSLMADAGEISAKAQVTAAAHLELGYDDGWTAVFEPTLTPYAGLETTRAGGLTASASIRVGVKISVDIGGLAGPYVQMTCGVTGEFSLDPHGCAYDASVSVDAEAEFGGELEIPVIDVEVASVDIGTITAASAELFSVSGVVPWCGGGASSCSGDGMCRDQVFGATVCEGSSGFQACSGPTRPGMVLASHCTCGPSGWTGCSDCMEIRSAP